MELENLLTKLKMDHLEAQIDLTPKYMPLSKLVKAAVSEEIVHQ